MTTRAPGTDRGERRLGASRQPAAASPGVPVLSLPVKYTIVIEKAPNNYAAYAPDLPGCVTTAATREEVVELMREAIEFHLEGLRRDGDPVPPPRTTAAQIDVAA